MGLCVFPSAPAAGWAQVPWAGAAAASVPCPSSPSASRWEPLTPPFQFQIGFQFPSPNQRPQNLSSPFQRRTRHDWDLLSHFCSNSKQRAISKGNEDPNDNQGGGKKIDGFEGKWQCFRLLCGSLDVTAFCEHCFRRAHKAISQSGDPHWGWCPGLSFHLFWDGSLPWEISEAKPSPSSSFLSLPLSPPLSHSLHLDYHCLIPV